VRWFPYPIALCVVFVLVACSPAKKPQSNPQETQTLKPHDQRTTDSLRDCPDALPQTDSVMLKRWPYLQSVSSNRATVVFGTQSDTAQPSLVIHNRDQQRAQVPAHIETPIPSLGMTLWSAVLEGLPADSAICYSVLIDDVVVGGPFSFHTAPTDLSSQSQFIVLGDYGAGTNEQRQLATAIAHLTPQPDFLLTTGDNAYPQGSHLQWQQNVFDIYREQWTKQPLFPSPGNHDYYTQNAQPYLDNMVLPRQARRDADQERYYSFDWGSVHIAVLDTEQPLLYCAMGNDDDMLHWLQSDLENSSAPWNIVALHRPPYSGHPSRVPPAVLVQKFIPVFEQMGVDIVFSGHDHFYELFNAIKKNKQVPHSDGGVVYLTTGGGGRALYPIGTHPLRTNAIVAHHFVQALASQTTLTINIIGLDGDILDSIHLANRVSPSQQ